VRSDGARVHEPTDIDGVTIRGGLPLLPVDPEHAAVTLAVAVETAPLRLPLVDVAARAAAACGVPPERAVALLAWLPVSRVAAWGDDGGLCLHPESGAADLAVRLGAWVSTRAAPASEAARVTAWVDGLSRAAASRDVRPAPGVPSPPAPSVAAAPPPPAALPTRVQALLDALDAAFVERRKHARFGLLALLAGQHVLLLGPPGTAKSALARALCACFADASYFEYLLSRFTHPDELFGPVSIPALKVEDYRRMTAGFLPTAGVAFLDEVFKASSAILNSLLTLVNERVFHHGAHRDPVPLLGLVGASNELPEADQGLEALFDRFLVRLSVPPVADPDAFLRVATGDLTPLTLEPGAALTRDEVDRLRASARAVTVPPAVGDALVVLWRTAADRAWGVSDRRWRQAVDLLRVAAAAAGRAALIPVDLMLLPPLLAPRPDREPEVVDAVTVLALTRDAPAHDLRAQWVLLGLDRVAPPPGAPPLPTDALERRHASAQRFLAWHHEVVTRIGADRARLEREVLGHPWLDSVPTELVAGHLEAARELVRVLERAEAYAAATRTPIAAARACVAALPEAPARHFGVRPALILEVADAGVCVGLTAEGQRIADPPARSADVPVLALSVTDLMDVLAGRRPLPSVIGDRMSRWQATTAASTLARLIHQGPIPAPPPWP
jgi:MoxR-like ATPase